MKLHPFQWSLISRCLKVLWLEVTGKYGPDVEKKKISQHLLCCSWVHTQARVKSPSGNVVIFLQAAVRRQGHGHRHRLVHLQLGSVTGQQVHGDGRHGGQFQSLLRPCQGEGDELENTQRWKGSKVSGRETNRKRQWKTGKGGTRERQTEEKHWDSEGGNYGRELRPTFRKKQSSVCCFF